MVMCVRQLHHATHVALPRGKGVRMASAIYALCTMSRQAPNGLFAAMVTLGYWIKIFNPKPCFPLVSSIDCSVWLGCATAVPELSFLRQLQRLFGDLQWLSSDCCFICTSICFCSVSEFVSSHCIASALFEFISSHLCFVFFFSSSFSVLIDLFIFSF